MEEKRFYPQPKLWLQTVYRLENIYVFHTSLLETGTSARKRRVELISGKQSGTFHIFTSDRINTYRFVFPRVLTPRLRDENGPFLSSGSEKFTTTVTIVFFNLLSCAVASSKDNETDFWEKMVSVFYKSSQSVFIYILDTSLLSWKWGCCSHILQL